MIIYGKKKSLSLLFFYFFCRIINHLEINIYILFLTSLFYYESYFLTHFIFQISCSIFFFAVCYIMEMSWSYIFFFWMERHLIQMSFSHDQKNDNPSCNPSYSRAWMRKKNKYEWSKIACPRCFSTSTIHKNTYKRFLYLWFSHLECRFYLFIFKCKFRTRAHSGCILFSDSFTLCNQSQDRPKDTKKKAKRKQVVQWTHKKESLA